MHKLATVGPIGGSFHSFRFQVASTGGEPAFVNLESDPAYCLRAKPLIRPLDEVGFYIGKRLITLPVNEQRFGYLDDPSGEIAEHVREVAAFNRRGENLNPRQLQTVVSSPLGIVAAYASGIGRYDSILPFGIPYGFENKDRFAKGVYIPIPQPQKIPVKSRYKTDMAVGPTQLLNGMKDEAVIDGVVLPRTPHPIKILTEVQEIGRSADGIRFFEGRATRLIGLKQLKELPGNTSILVYSEVYRLARMLRLPPQLLKHLFIGGDTLRTDDKSQLQEFGSLNKVHPWNLDQACRQGL